MRKLPVGLPAPAKDPHWREWDRLKRIQSHTGLRQSSWISRGHLAICVSIAEGFAVLQPPEVRVGPN